MNQHDAYLEQREAEDFKRYLKKVGIPTFQEYVKLSEDQRSKLKLVPGNIFNLISDNKQPLGSVRKFKHIFVTRAGVKYDCGDSLEKIESIMIEEGLTRGELDMKPEMRETETTGYYIEVTWTPKTRSIFGV